jgi:enoyl-CoA hydratase/carnithine racemase
VAGLRIGDVVVERAGPVVRATIDRPRVRNAISPGVIEGLEGAIDEATAGTRVLVLRGAGGVFCAGADLDFVRTHVDDSAALEKYVGALAGALDRLEQAAFVTVAVIEGFALAGGCEILLACDVTVAAEDARIGDRHLEFGLLPGAGGSVRLARALPPALSRYLLLTGETISGSQAAAWGLVSLAVPIEQIDEATERVVARIASRSSDALAGAKQMLLRQRDVPHDQAIIGERSMFLAHMVGSADVREGLDAFETGRPPRFALSNKEGMVR